MAIRAGWFFFDEYQSSLDRLFCSPTAVQGRGQATAGSTICSKPHRFSRTLSGGFHYRLEALPGIERAERRAAARDVWLRDGDCNRRPMSVRGGPVAVLVDVRSS